MDLAHFWNNTTGGYQIDQSLRFNSADSSTLTATLPSNGGSVHTTSAWIKTSNPAAMDNIFAAYPSESNYGTSTTYDILGWYSEGPYVFVGNGPSSQSALYLGAIDYTQKYRDSSAWYHVVWVSSSTQHLIYVNGVLRGSKSRTQNNSYYNQNRPHRISAYRAPNGSVGGYINCYMAEVHFISNQSLDPSSFGETDTITGAWIPKKYSGSYGTNGFYLKFDPSATNGIGHDHSGNGNNFTATGFSTSGTGTDVMSDTPTNNYATINPLGSNASSYSEGNLKFVGDTANVSARGAICTQSVSSGKWYWEVTIDAVSGSSIVGVVKEAGLSSTSNTIIDLYYLNGAYSYAAGSGNKIEGFGSSVTSSSYGNTYTTNDVIGVALDLDNGAIYFAKNNTWQNSGDPTSGSSKTGAAFTSFSGGYAAMSCGAQSHTATFNFGQRAFAYTPPTGYKALSTGNLPEPTIKKGSKYFDTKLYTGNSTGGAATQTLTGFGFSPDFVWIKGRASSTANHSLFDQVRGTGKVLWSQSTNQEETNYSRGYLSAFTSDGFTVTTGSTDGRDVNGLSTGSPPDTYVAWAWDANGAGSSNTAGSITSTVSANATAGFSIVTYTGTGANATVGHGLGVAPSFIIVKNRNTSDHSWYCYHKDLGASYYIFLNLTAAAGTGAAVWNGVPSSSVFTLGTSNAVNGSTLTYVAYCFSEVAGYSKFGSYTGNGSSDGPFIATSFAPSWIVVKRTDSADTWNILDNKRGPINPNQNRLYPDLSSAESGDVGARADFLSNGFKLRTTNGDMNGSGGTYIFAAFAEHPFKYANAR